MSQQKLAEKSKEELIEIIRKLKKQKKYGLVWEEKPEEVVERCKKELPVLEEVKDKAILKDPDGRTNLLIEGDNYHALSVLNYTHAGKIDVIYIDPPYNTGAQDWKYNNDYVDNNDRYRHSKWISMMDHRLTLARNLLSDKGIICCTVDDYEVPRLTILMDSIFGEENRLGTVVIKNNPSGRSTERGFSIAHEYGLFYSRSTHPVIGRLARSEKQIARYKETDEQGRFEWVNFRKHGALRKESPKMFYPIYVTRKSIRIPKMSWNNQKQEWVPEELPNKSEKVVYPIDEDGFDRRWKWGLTRSEREIGQMKVRKDKNGDLAVYIKARMNDKGMLPLTWWDKTEYSATSQGTNLLKEIFKSLQVFSYPKSLYAVIDSIRVMSTKNDCVVLDFFAGSGTTGHAVLELNKEDQGKRQFILCTNNENKIAEDVTYPRIQKVIGGYGHTKGIPANFRYFKTSFVIKNNVSDDVKRELVARSTEMICIKEGTFDEVKNGKAYKIFRNKEQVTGILFDLDALNKFKKEVVTLGLPVHIYVFSLTNDTFDEDFEDLGVDHELCPIPESILEVYRKIFK